MTLLRVVALCLLARVAGAQLTITFLDVGQGDAALVRSPTGRNVLIDAGPSPTRVAQWLVRARVDTVHLAIASHNHADHIGGMPLVLETIPVRNYMENGMVATTRTYARIVTLLEERGIPVLQATPRRVDLGGGAALRILPNAGNPRTQNDASIGVELTYGGFRVIFTGDAEGRQRQAWRCRPEPAAGASRGGGPGACRAQVLKVAHHGSINGTDATWLAPISPCVAVISVGARNSFGHPSGEVLRLLDSAGVRVFRTDRVGQVTVKADSSGSFTVNGVKQACRPAR